MREGEIMAKKKYPCGMAKDKVCEFAGGRRFNYGFMSGIAGYCRKSKRFVFALKSCPLETAPNTACTPTNGGLAQADNSPTPAAIRG